MGCGASKAVQPKSTTSWFKSAKKHCNQCGKASTKAERPACKSCGSMVWDFEVGMGGAGGGSMGEAPAAGGGMGGGGGIDTENRWANLATCFASVARATAFRPLRGNSVAASGQESAGCAGRLEYGTVSDVFNVPLFAARRSFPPSWCHSARTTRGLRLFTSQRTVALTPPTTPWPRSMQVCCQAFPCLKASFRVMQLSSYVTSPAVGAFRLYVGGAAMNK